MQTELFFAAFFIFKVAGDELRILHAFLKPVEDFSPQEGDDDLGEVLARGALAKLCHNGLRTFTGFNSLLQGARKRRLKVTGKQVEEFIGTFKLSEFEANVVEIVSAIGHEH